MNTAAIVSTFTVLGSLAYAAGQGAALRPQPVGAITRSPVHEDGAVSQRHQGTTMAALAGSDGSCTIGEPLNWFTQVHPLPECAALAIGAGIIGNRFSGDVDLDGADDVLVLLKQTSDGNGGSAYTSMWERISDNTDSMSGSCCIGEHVVFLSLINVTTNPASTVIVPVMEGQLLRNGACALGWCEDTTVEYAFSMLRDMDADGDLDLVARADRPPTGSPWITERRFFWIENTVKANPPLAADINRDGVVDGKDLASVLAAWTP